MVLASDDKQKLCELFDALNRDPDHLFQLLCQGSTPLSDDECQLLKESCTPQNGEMDFEDVVQFLFPGEAFATAQSSAQLAMNSNTLLPQPANPSYKIMMLNLSGESTLGDVRIANGLISAGMSCQLVQYVATKHDSLVEALGHADCVIVRGNTPPGVNADHLDTNLRNLEQMGKRVWPSPDVKAVMSSTEVMARITSLSIGLPDTAAYDTPEALAAGLRRTVAFQPRVVRRSCGGGKRSSEGTWLVKLQSGNYCSQLGKRLCTDDERIDVMELASGRLESHTLGQFIEFCANGRTAKSGIWGGLSSGKYLADGSLIDQRFCPRIAEGDVRVHMIGKNVVSIEHRKQSGSDVYQPDVPSFAGLVAGIQRDVPTLMSRLGLHGKPLPLVWSVDFVNVEPGTAGTPSTMNNWAAHSFDCSGTNLVEREAGHVNELASLIGATATCTLQRGS